MAANPAVWFEIYVQDMPRARTFYETVLGTSLARLNDPPAEMWAFPGDMTTPGCSGSLVCVAGMPSGGNSTIVYFHCGDCSVEEARVPSAGGTIMRPKMSIGPYGFVTLAYDTEGNLFGLHSLK